MNIPRNGNYLVDSYDDYLQSEYNEEKEQYEQEHLIEEDEDEYIQRS